MAQSLSQLLRTLKQSGFTFKPLMTNVFYHPTEDRKSAIRRVFNILEPYGAKPIVKSPHSGVGAVKLGQYTFVVTRMKYTPQNIQVTSNNKGMANRTKFGAYLADVINNTLRPTTIIFKSSSKTIVRNVLSVKFSGNGVSDLFLILANSKKLRLSVNPPSGMYRQNITDRRILNMAYNALAKATELGDIEADIDDNNVMTLFKPVVFKADVQSVREQVFSDLNGGLVVIGEFKPQSFEYRGAQNEIVIKCNDVFASPMDMKSKDTPWFIIDNSERGQINDLRGLAVHLIAKGDIPPDSTIVHLNN